jgi:hypothetical protein
MRICLSQWIDKRLLMVMCVQPVFDVAHRGEWTCRFAIGRPNEPAVDVNENFASPANEDWALNGLNGNHRSLRFWAERPSEIQTGETNHASSIAGTPAANFAPPICYFYSTPDVYVKFKFTRFQ